jgi:hypothetical protein
MFGRQVKFVWAGDNPSLVQCSQCHQIGHFFSSPKCRLAPGANRCFRCGGPHHSDNHDFECSGPHAVQGVCDCRLKCILCKGDNHTARDKACPRRGDFAPPRLSRPAPVEPALVVDSRMVAPLAVSRAKARTLPSGKGKGPAKADLVEQGVRQALTEAVRSVPEGICPKAGVYTLLCFCCPMPSIEDYRRLYVHDTGYPPVLSSMGKSIIDLHSEFKARKAAQEPAIREAQTKHGKIFHQDEDLAAVIAGCESQNVPLYGPSAVEAPSWIRNMPLEEMIGEAALARNAVEVADTEVNEWKAAKKGRSAEAETGAPTLHTMMQAGGGDPLT